MKRRADLRNWRETIFLPFIRSETTRKTGAGKNVSARDAAEVIVIDVD